MKILIAYDGSEHADVALEELHRAGLHDVDAIVLSVSELWLLKSEMIEKAVADRFRTAVDEYCERAVNRGHETATRGADRLKQKFPHWHIEAVGAAGSAVDTIIRKAESWSADLVVVGPHAHPTFLHPLPGSVSLGVLTHAPCSVRIMRAASNHEDDGAPRLIVAIDGSHGAQAAIEMVKSRLWPSGTHVYVLMVVDTRLIPVVVPGLEIGPTSECWAEEIVARAVDELRDSGFTASASIERGDPRILICKAAESWRADCIFLGSLGLSYLPWMRLGSIATAVSIRAHCSVEVVRPGACDVVSQPIHPAETKPNK